MNIITNYNNMPKINQHSLTLPHSMPTLLPACAQGQGDIIQYREM